MPFKSGVQPWRHFRSFALATAGVFLFAANVTAQGALDAAESSQEVWDNTDLAPVYRVLPPEFINGPYWVVDEGVGYYDFLNLFVVESKWGTFEVEGNLLLRTRLRELMAIGELEKESGVEVAVDAFLDSASFGVRAAVEVATHPVRTVKGIPGGIASRFKKIRRNVKDGYKVAKDVTSKKDKKKRPEDEDKPDLKDQAADAAVGLGKRFAGIDRAEREWSAKLGVDPYTTNPLLRKQIHRVANIEGLVGKGTKLFVPPVIPIPKQVIQVFKLVTEKDPGELREINTRWLKEMGCDQGLIDALFEVEPLTPSRMTLLVAMLHDAEDVEDRADVVRQALSLPDEPTTLWFLESLVIASYFDNNEMPLTRAVVETGVPAAVAEDGRLIVFTAFDFGKWTPEIAQFAEEFTDAYAEFTKGRELWVAGRVSPLFLEHFSALGWKIRTDLRRTTMQYFKYDLEEASADDGES